MALFISPIVPAGHQLSFPGRTTTHPSSMCLSRSSWLPAISVSTRRSVIVPNPSISLPLSSSSTLQMSTATASAMPITIASASTMRPAVSAATTPLTIISTIVGVCVLIGSLLYKVPQVVRVVRRQSADGISALMYALETIGTTFSAVYFARRAFPFSTYGETVFIMIQNLLLLALIVVYQRLPRVPAFLAALLYIIAVTMLVSPLIPLRVLMVLQLCSIPILNLARVPQIALNFRRKSTGELSPITLGLQLLGNVARIFTTLAQVRDPLMFVATCVATCFNATLFAQWILYSRRIAVTPSSS